MYEMVLDTVLPFSNVKIKATKYHRNYFDQGYQLGQVAGRQLFSARIEACCDDVICFIWSGFGDIGLFCCKKVDRIRQKNRLAYWMSIFPCAFFILSYSELAVLGEEGVYYMLVVPLASDWDVQSLRRMMFVF